MTPEKETPKQALCLTTNTQYRTAIVNLCHVALQKARTKQEFTAIMETITTIPNTISDYPNIDQTFIHGTACALLLLGRWEE